MRVQFKKTDGELTIIETIQMIQNNNGSIGFVLPYSIYGERRKYDFYLSTTPAEITEFNRWSDHLLRTGYLDLSRSEILFVARVTEEKER